MFIFTFLPENGLRECATIQFVRVDQLIAMHPLGTPLIPSILCNDFNKRVIQLQTILILPILHCSLFSRYGSQPATRDETKDTGTKEGEGRRREVKSLSFFAPLNERFVTEPILSHHSFANVSRDKQKRERVAGLELVQPRRVRRRPTSLPKCTPALLPDVSNKAKANLCINSIR